MKARKGPSTKKVISRGGKAPEGGITKGKTPKETEFQKDLKNWPPKVGKKKG
jgi:hypothetical protein